MEGIKMPSPEEKKAAIEKIRAMEQKVSTLTEEERMYICDMGFFNSVIKGYLIEAMKFADADFSREDIESALRGLKSSFDSTSAAEAAEVYMKF